MNQAELQTKFNNRFNHFISTSNNPELRRYQQELFQFFILGYEIAQETEQGVFHEGKAVVAESIGANQINYTVTSDVSVKLQDILGIIVKGDEVESDD